MANWDWILGKDGTVVVVMYVKRKYLHGCWYIYKHVFSGHKKWMGVLTSTSRCREWSFSAVETNPMDPMHLMSAGDGLWSHFG